MTLGKHAFDDEIDTPMPAPVEAEKGNGRVEEEKKVEAVKVG